MRPRLRVGWVLRGRWIALAAALGFASAASGEDPDAEVGGSDFSRPGFYVGAGGTYALTVGWSHDFDNDLNDRASDLANASAEAAAPTRRLDPLTVLVDGADLEDGFLGFHGLVGYRVADLVAFEIEGEKLFVSDKTDLAAEGRAQTEQSGTFVTDSVGTHRTEVKDVWTIMANLKLLPFSGRFQPFGVFGLGLQHSRLDAEMETSGLATLTKPPNPVVVPADFVLRSKKTSLDGALRVGVGLDVYATESVGAELKADYVVPFSEVTGLVVDYFSVRWGLIYRF